jgi:hypothetical protein
MWNGELRANENPLRFVLRVLTFVIPSRPASAAHTVAPEISGTYPGRDDLPLDEGGWRMQDSDALCSLPQAHEQILNSQRYNRGRVGIMDAIVVAGVGLTAAFFVVGVMGKWLASSSVREQHFYLGMESALAAVSGAAAYGFELSRKLERLDKAAINFGDLAHAIGENQGRNTLFLVGALVAYFAVASFHMIWDKPAASKGWRWIMLIGIGNFLGLSTLFGFIIAIKKDF